MPSYRGYRFPPEIISHAVWLYHRFSLSFRDVEDLLAERGITVTYETIRQWCLTFGIDYARRLRSRRGRQGDTWHLDELFIRIQGRQQYLWRAVDEDGDEIDILVQPRRNRRAAIRFFRKLLKTQGGTPRRLITHKLPSYGAALSRGLAVPRCCTAGVRRTRAGRMISSASRGGSPGRPPKGRRSPALCSPSAVDRCSAVRDGGCSRTTSASPCRAAAFP